MLQASREELVKTVDEDKRGLSRLVGKVTIFLDVYIWEPLCTGFRFCHLVVIFVPVILSVPVIWLGRRQPDRDNERSGTLWWYNFLVWGMEAAGPAFIKVWAILFLPFLSLSY
jgi:aarF domain-containing kinase